MIGGRMTTGTGRPAAIVAISDGPQSGEVH